MPVLQIRVTDEENEMLNGEAAKANLTKSALIKSWIRGESTWVTPEASSVQPKVKTTAVKSSATSDATWVAFRPVPKPTKKK